VGSGKDRRQKGEGGRQQAGDPSHAAFYPLLTAHSRLPPARYLPLFPVNCNRKPVGSRQCTRDQVSCGEFFQVAP